MKTVEQSVGRESLCLVRTGEDVFGIATGAVVETLYACEVRSVPLAPSFVAGVLACRGEVLLAVSLRSLLGMAAMDGECGAVVLKDRETGEAYALLMDELLDVTQVSDSAWEANPATLDERRGMLFDGLYRSASGPVVRLHAERLQPSWLMRHAGTLEGAR